MNRILLIAPAVLLSLSLSGCTGGVQSNPSATPAPAASSSAAAAADQVLAQAEEGQDLGNGRPVVSNDGLMVRRLVVIAVHSELDADVAGIRKKLEAAAGNTKLSNISPDVLEPAVLQQVVPEIIVALPATATLDDGRAIVNRATQQGTGKLGVNNFFVLSALVHDLRFSVGSANPTALSAAVDREGIVSDALGNYDTDIKDGQLSISYTGPLLGDEIVQSVRTGIARPAHAAATTVTVGPRSTTGTGVDMSIEPEWDPEQLAPIADHPHK